MPLSRKAVFALHLLDASSPLPAPQLAPDDGGAEGLRIARTLEREGCVEVVRGRPKQVVLGARPFPRALHGMLRTRPHLAGLLGGSTLRVLAVLATASETHGSVSGRTGLTAQAVVRLSGLSERTVRAVLRTLSRRSLLEKKGTKYRIAAHAPELANLGRLYRDHVLEDRLRAHPGVFPVALRGTRMIVESEHHVSGLDPTAFHRFQEEGADVLAARFQYAVTFDDEGTSLDDALADLAVLAPAPRTLRAVQAFVRARGRTDG